MDLPVLRRNHQHVQRREDHAPAGATSGWNLPARSGGSPVTSEAPWTLLGEMNELHRHLDRLENDFLGRAERPGVGAGTGWRPAADVAEMPDAYLVEIELPAVKKDDVTVEVGGGELIVAGEIKERERVGWLRTRTRRTGRFDYRVALPTDIDPDLVSASLSDGVLSVRVPKTEHAERRRVAITG